MAATNDVQIMWSLYLVAMAATIYVKIMWLKFVVAMAAVWLMCVYFVHCMWQAWLLQVMCT